MDRLVVEWIVYVSATPLFAFCSVRIAYAMWLRRATHRPVALLALAALHVGVTCAFAIFTIASVWRWWDDDGMLPVNAALALRAAGSTALIVAEAVVFSWLIRMEKGGESR